MVFHSFLYEEFSFVQGWSTEGKQILFVLFAFVLKFDDKKKITFVNYISFVIMFPYRNAITETNS